MSKAGKLHCRIWGLDPNLSLERVRELLNINYHESIEYLSDRSDLNLSHRDKTLMHCWNSISAINTYQFQTDQTTQIVQYLTAVGYLENAVPESKAFGDDEQEMLLNRERRVGHHNCYAIFFRYNARVYSIIYGTSSAFRAKTILMGNGFKQRKKPEWGKINDKLAQYNLGSDFFYWVFNKQNHSLPIKTLFGDIEISDIEGIGRLSAERNGCDTKGTGPNYVNEISSKSALGINQLVYQSDFEIVTSCLNVVLNLNELSDCIVDTIRSLTLEPQTKQFEGIIGREVSLLLQLYLEIIPGLVSAFNDERATGIWTNTESAEAQRQWALEVIQELSYYHRLTIAEISQLPSFINK